MVKIHNLDYIIDIDHLHNLNNILIYIIHLLTHNKYHIEVYKPLSYLVFEECIGSLAQLSMIYKHNHLIDKKYNDE